MLHRIIDLIVREDTFRLFTNRSSSSVFESLEEPPRVRNTEELEERIRVYFNRILTSASSDSLYFNEASRILGSVERVFSELREINEPGVENAIRNPMDDVVDQYSESLTRFIEDMGIPIVKDHVGYVLE